MSMSDPISDMLTRIRNSLNARKDSVLMNYSRMKENIVKVLKQEGYINDYRVTQEGTKSCLEVDLKYSNNRSAIYGIARVSKPGRRVYVGRAEIPYILNGLGIAIISTSKGIIADHAARKLNLGGEHICNIW